MSVEWSYGLCSCSANYLWAGLTFLCPCVTSFAVAKKIDKKVLAVIIFLFYFIFITTQLILGFNINKAILSSAETNGQQGESNFTKKFNGPLHSNSEMRQWLQKSGYAFLAVICVYIILSSFEARLRSRKTVA